MPGKRSKKEIDRSTGSFGGVSSGGPSGLDDVSQHKAAGSSSSGSVGDESESATMKLCCFPAGCPFGEDTLSPENAMVKVVCNYEACNMSQFMHLDCFNHWEEGILNHLRSHGRARSWSEKQRRQNLWTKKGYDLAYRACLCKCKHGHLRKDLNWVPQDPTPSSENEQASGKKKNRKRHKDLPSLGGFAGMVRTKSKPIPNSKDHRNRHSSTNSNVSVDQGYLSASPVTCDAGSSFFSPPFHPHHKPTFTFPHSHSQSFRGGNIFHAPSTSPLPEMPDDLESISPHFTPSPLSTDTSPTSPLGVFTPPLTPETNLHGMKSDNRDLPSLDMNEIPRMLSKSSEQSAKDQQANIESMTALIDNLQRHRNADPRQPFPDVQPGNLPTNDQQLAQVLLQQAFTQLRINQTQNAEPEPYSTNAPLYPQVPFNSPTASTNHLEQYQQEQAMRNALVSNATQQQASALAAQQERRNFNSSAQVLLALRQKEQREMEQREFNKFLLSMMSTEENKTQVLSFPADKARHGNTHTEIRLVPMRSTSFAKRYDFSVFESVLPRQHINPYRIKMEGEGYGSDDLRNFILASLSKSKCAQMNCVLCGVDLPVYDHFPLVDGTMFLSPEKNERSTKYSFKIKVEGKCEYVHAACLRCLEGLHNIVCRLCNTRWEGLHLQLGTLYMYDIFAATPCCQQRLCCKQCGGAVVDIRQGLTYFSEYSAQKACPHCHALDHHFVHSATTYQLMGLVFS